MNIPSLIEKRNFKLDIVRKSNLHQVRTLDEYGECMFLLYIFKFHNNGDITTFSCQTSET